MKYGIPVSAGVLDPHFGHCEGFALIETDEEEMIILSQEIIISPGHVPGALPPWLAEQGTQVVIAGGMGGRAIEIFQQSGIDVILGAPPLSPDEVVIAYMNGTLTTGPNACGDDHEHGCGGH